MTAHQYLMLLTMAAIVILLRFFPALVFGQGKRVPPLLLYLGHVLTAAAIAMLAVYSLAGELEITSCGARRVVPMLAASAVTVLLHIRFKNPLISILGGTACFMILVQKFFL